MKNDKLCLFRMLKDVKQKTTLMGLEPTTPRLEVWCANHCATRPMTFKQLPGFYTTEFTKICQHNVAIVNNSLNYCYRFSSGLGSVLLNFIFAFFDYCSFRRVPVIFYVSFCFTYSSIHGCLNASLGVILSQKSQFRHFSTKSMNFSSRVGIKVRKGRASG